MDDQAAPYTYTALAGGEIRLARLMPGPYSATVEVLLDHYVLGSADIPEYEALSYTWGDTSIVHPISCNGGRLCVADNLRNALRRLRYEEKPRLLWIDKICINQDDVHERGQQVSIMGFIFSGAALVPVWLGEDDTGDAEAAVDFFCMLIVTYRSEDSLENDPQAWPQRVEERPEYETGRHAVTNLLAATWFKRVWVFQEALCAKELLFLRGKWSLPYEMFLVALLYHVHVELSRRNDSPFRSGDSMGHIPQARIDYKTYLDGEKSEAYSLSMLRLIYRTRRMDATDPRDKIYALLHLTTDKDALKIQPRYDQTFEECYTHATRMILSTDRNLLCLSMAFPTEARRDALPTWALDLRSTTLSWYSHYRIDPAYRLYAATGKSRVCIRDTPDQMHLALRGLYIGTVAASSTRSGSDDNVPVIGRDVLDRGQWFRFAREQANHNIYTPTGDTMEVAFANIICGDVTRSRSNGDPERVHSSARALQQCIALFDVELQEEEDYLVTSDNYDYAYPVSYATHSQRMIYLDTGYLGLARQDCMIGDKVFLLMGGDMPFLLRPAGDNYYTYLCEAYIHGIMEGEALVNARRRADSTWRAEGSSWLQELGDPPFPFETEEVILI